MEKNTQPPSQNPPANSVLPKRIRPLPVSRKYSSWPLSPRHRHRLLAFHRLPLGLGELLLLGRFGGSFLFLFFGVVGFHGSISRKLSLRRPAKHKKCLRRRISTSIIQMTAQSKAQPSINGGDIRSRISFAGARETAYCPLPTAYCY